MIFRFTLILSLLKIFRLGDRLPFPNPDTEGDRRLPIATDLEHFLTQLVQDDLRQRPLNYGSAPENY